MATSKAIITQGGVTKQIPDADTLHVGSGLDQSAAAALALGGTNATSVDIGKTGILVTIKGNSQVDGTEIVVGTTTYTDNAQFNGNVTIGNAATDTLTLTAALVGNASFQKEVNHTIDVIASTTASTVGGNLTLAAGAGNGAAGGDMAVNPGSGTTAGVLNLGSANVSVVNIGNAADNPAVNVLGSGAIDLANGTLDVPAGTSFKVGGVALVSSNWTAANIDKLLDGSNADSLHTHAAAKQLTQDGLTTTGLADGDFGYISTADTLSKTDSAAIGTVRVIGANEGTAGSMTVGGVIENAKFTTDGTSPGNGDPVYLAAAADDTSTGAGKLTATAPTAGVLAEVGICLNNANYVGSKTAEVLLQVKVPVVL